MATFEAFWLNGWAEQAGGVSGSTVSHGHAAGHASSASSGTGQVLPRPRIPAASRPAMQPVPPQHRHGAVAGASQSVAVIAGSQRFRGSTIGITVTSGSATGTQDYPRRRHEAELLLIGAL